MRFKLTNNETMSKMSAGRPKAQIDWNKVDEYLRAGCNGMAVASLLGCHVNTLYEAVKHTHNCNFSEYSAQKRAEGVVLMEKAIYDNALKNSGADRIFWLKNRAGWKDRTDVAMEFTQMTEHDAEDAIPCLRRKKNETGRNI